jgi:galactokinase
VIDLSTSNAAMPSQTASLREAFLRFAGQEPQLSFAPGRINLIGEHTDYTDGFVLPVSLSMGTWVAAAAREDRMLRVFSEAQNELAMIDLDVEPAQARRHWSDYIAGVAWALRRLVIDLRGADLFVVSDVPMGSGLSSSAALEVATAYALLSVAAHTLSPMQIACACQQAENEFVGARCGLMDQFIATHGQSDRAVLLDCMTRTWRAVALPATHRWILANTMVRHALAHGEYNNRRAECERIVNAMRRRFPARRRIADLERSELTELIRDLDSHLRLRLKHVYEENRRVLDMVSALERDDVAQAGRLLLASHASLRSCFEVSCPELDLMVQLAMNLPGVVGARMIGGGFGGCTLSIVDAQHAHEAAVALRSDYALATGTDPVVFVCEFGGAGGIRA